MKNKHRKSEAVSDSEPEENVDARAGNDDDETQAGKNNSSQKSATKRRSARGASVPKPAVNTNDDADSDNDDSTAIEPKERENGEKKPLPNKRRKKENQRASTSARDLKPEDVGSEYEVWWVLLHFTTFASWNASYVLINDKWLDWKFSHKIIKFPLLRLNIFRFSCVTDFRVGLSLFATNIIGQSRILFFFFRPINLPRGKKCAPYTWS